MNTGGLNASDVLILNEFADMMMWAGRDLAADAIYALVEAEGMASCESDAAEWRGAFAD